MTTIPQRELRNNVSDVLRRAEGGEHFTVTVDGRPVAEVGPIVGARRLGRPARLAEILAATPIDEGWAQELERLREEDRAAATDPWST